MIFAEWKKKGRSKTFASDFLILSRDLVMTFQSLVVILPRVFD